MKYFKLLLPFSALAVFFILIGFLLNDKHQIYFGIVWLLIALIAYTYKKFKHHHIQGG